MTIDEIRNKLVERKIRWRVHASKRLIERNIAREDVITAIWNGKVIEDYTNDFPFPSCLILGFYQEEAPLHIVCAIGQDFLWVITVYKPDSSKWEDDFQTRKRKL